MSSLDPIDPAAATRSARESLQQGRIDEAISALQVSLGRSQGSAEVYELLGVAYAQKGMTNEGVQALSSAVNLSPQNASTRVNLAVALQRAGRMQEAIVQINEALRLDPANAKAAAALNALQSTAPGGPPLQQPGYLRQGPGPLDPTASMPAQPGLGQTQPVYGVSPAQQPYGQPGAYNPQPGAYNPPPGYGMPPPPGYTPPGQQPVYPGNFTQVDPNGWSPLNIIPVLTRPVEFFQGQRGQADVNQPLGFVVVTGFIMAAFGLLIGLTTGSTARVANTGPAGFGAGSLLGSVFLGPVCLAIGVLIIAGIFHLFTMIFGGRAGYPATLRAVVYSWSPSIVGSMLGSLLAIGGGALHPVVMVINFACYIWVFVLLVIGLREVHAMSTGSAFGAAFIPGALFAALMFFLVVVAGAAFLAALQNGGPGMKGGSFGTPPGNFGAPRSFPGAGANFPASATPPGNGSQ